jgi:hypothetical protein
MQFVTTSWPTIPTGRRSATGLGAQTAAARFNEQAGLSLPPGDKTHDADLLHFDSRANQVSMSLWNGVVGKASTSIEGAVNLAVFDDREAILRRSRRRCRL